MRIKKDFTVDEVSQLTGFKHRMLDYLCRSGVLVPTLLPRPGRGRDRKYRFHDVVVGRALSDLLRCGISVSKLKKALEALRSEPEITPKNLPGKYLVTDGTDFFFTNRTNVFVNVSRGRQLVFAFVIEIRRVHADMLRRCHALSERPRRNAG
jgi:DNA-binding transcriptional MerR regulator